MKRDVVGRVSYSEERREALLDEFEPTAWGQYQTFASWVRKPKMTESLAVMEAHLLDLTLLLAFLMADSFSAIASSNRKRMNSALLA
jgi:hypothetical protein